MHIVEQVEARVNAPRAPGFDGQVAGRQITRTMGQDFALDLLQQLGGGAAYGQNHGQPDGRRNAGGGTDPPFGTGGMTSSLGPQTGIRAAMNPNGMHGLHPGGADEGGMSMGLGGEQLLGGSSFALNRATSSGGVLSVWSRSAQSQFSGQDGALALNGDVRSTMVGADYATGRMVTGVSLAHTRGLGSYAGVDTGRMTSAVTGLYPWIGYKASERVTVWTVAGYGAGGLMLSRPGAGAPIETGLSMAMAAGGGRGQILGGGDGFGLAFKADALWVGTRTKAATGPGGNLASTRAAVSRLRTAIEGSQRMSIASRMALTPSIEIGIRQDGGDADTGRGMDLGAGLVLADSVTGLAVDIRVRRLLVHEAEGFAESGMSISVSYNPTPSTPLGFTARVSPVWGGESMSGAEALWGRETHGGDGAQNGAQLTAPGLKRRSATGCRWAAAWWGRRGSASGHPNTGGTTGWATASARSAARGRRSNWASMRSAGRARCRAARITAHSHGPRCGGRGGATARLRRAVGEPEEVAETSRRAARCRRNCASSNRGQPAPWRRRIESPRCVQRPRGRRLHPRGVPCADTE